MESWLQRMMASRLPKFYEPCLAILLLAVEVFADSRLCGRRSPCGRPLGSKSGLRRAEAIAEKVARWPSVLRGSAALSRTWRP